MPVDPVFGEIVTGADVDNAVLSTLHDLLGYYLDEVSAQAGVAPITHPRTWGSRQSTNRLTEDRYPSVTVVTQGVDLERSVDDDDEVVGGVWLASVVARVNAKGTDDARHLVMRYAAAIRQCITQHGMLGGRADWSEAVEETYDLEDDDSQRVVAACQVDFRVSMDRIGNRFGGPSGPPPWAPAPLVTRHEEHVNPMEA